MCGLFGVFGKVPNKRQVVTDLALQNMARGTDSTGYADVFIQNNNFVIRKNALDAYKFRHQLKMSRGDLVIGHTRHATTGAVCARNAHPWRIGNIIGAHNGMVLNQFSVERYLKDVHNDETKYEVDSQYLLHMVDRFGHMGNANGMLNLTYWDMSVKQLVFMVHQNPMNIALDTSLRWLVWSSDKNHLQRVIDANKLEGSVKYLSLSNERLNFELNNNTLSSTPGKVPFDEKHRTNWDSHNEYGYYAARSTYSGSTTSYSGSSSYGKSSSSQYSKDVLSDENIFVKVNGVWVSEKVAKEMAEQETALVSGPYNWPAD